MASGFYPGSLVGARPVGRRGGGLEWFGLGLTGDGRRSAWGGGHAVEDEDSGAVRNAFLGEGGDGLESGGHLFELRAIIPGARQVRFSRDDVANLGIAWRFDQVGEGVAWAFAVELRPAGDVDHDAIDRRVLGQPETRLAVTGDLLVQRGEQFRPLECHQSPQYEEPGGGTGPEGFVAQAKQAPGIFTERNR